MVETLTIKSRYDRNPKETKTIKIKTTPVRIKIDVYRALVKKSEKEGKSICEIANQILAEKLNVI